MIKKLITFAVSIAIGATLILALENPAKALEKEVKFEDSDGGFNFSLKGEKDRCIFENVPGKGKMEALIESVCFQGKCYEFLIKPPEEVYACRDGRFIEDTSLLDYSLQDRLQTIDGSCQEVFPGRNKPDEKRINLVFVGSDYHLIDRQDEKKGFDAFLWDIKAILGEHTHNGFFDREPFRSNREKFNLWYVDRFHEMQPVVEPYTYEVHEKRNNEASRGMYWTAKKCELAYDLKNVIPIHLVPNKGTLDSAITIATTREVQLFDHKAHQACQKTVKKALKRMVDKNRDSCPDPIAMTFATTPRDVNGNGISGEIADIQLLNRLNQLTSTMNLCRKQKNFAGLLENLCASGIDNLGRVTDHGRTLVHEFGHKFELFDISPYESTENPEWNGVTIGNCFIAQSKSACLSGAPWIPMTGKKCFEGCIFGVSSFRPEQNSTYTYGFMAKGSGTAEEFDSLGLWNEWYLDQMITAFLKL